MRKKNNPGMEYTTDRKVAKRAFPCLLMLAAMYSASSFAVMNTIHNNTIWKDTMGNDIKAQGGSIIQVNGIYYWYGMDYLDISQYPLPNPPAPVNCYSSTDLVNWTFEGVVLDPVSLDWTQWVGRPSVIFNSKTKKYVMAVKNNGVKFLTSDTPTGVFTYSGDSVSSIAGEVITGDTSVYKDTDGKAYLLAVTDNTDNKNYPNVQDSMNIIELDPNDYVGVVGYQPLWKVSFLVDTFPKKEAPAILKRNGEYYLFVSETHDWKSSKTWYKRAFSLNGFDTTDTWSLVTTVQESNNSFNTQHDFVKWIAGKPVYFGDRWNNRDTSVGGTGLNAWFPMEFDATGAPIIKGYKDWSIDTATGQVEGIFVDEENSWRIQYGNVNWGTTSDTNASGGALKISSITGDYAEMTFIGSQFTWYAKKGTAAGKAEVYLDDMTTPVAIVDLYSNPPVYQVPVYEDTALGYGTHTIRIKVSGTKNPNSTGYYVNIDKFEYN